jgi:molybdate transport system substrate-binding protein
MIRIGVASLLLAWSALWGQKPLEIYCGVTMSKAIKKIAAIYTQRHHHEVRIVQGGSGELLEEITHANVGDLYLPGNPRYITHYPDPTFFAYRRTIASMQLVVFTRAGNPFGVQKPADLTRPNLRVGIGAPELGSIGKVTKRLISENFDPNFYNKIAYNALYFAIDSRDLNRLYDQGKIDVGITWKPAVYHCLEKKKTSLIIFDYPHKVNAHQPIMIALLAHAKQPEEGKKFIETILSKAGQKILRSEGFDGL